VLMRLLLALLLLAPGMAWGQANWTKCADEGQFCAFSGVKEVRYGFEPLALWTPVQQFTGGVGCSNTVFVDPARGYGKQCQVRDVGAAPPPLPEPPPPPAWTGELDLSWTAPTRNTDGTPIVPPLSYRVTINGVAVTTVSTLTYTASGLPAGQHCATVATISAGGTSAESLPACATLAPPATNVCTAPQPAAETQTVACPAGTTGSWTQTRTYSAAAFPTCWTAGAWTPTSAPAGACVAIPPPPVAVVAPVVAGQNMAPVFGITGTNTRGTTVLGFVPVGRACTGPVVYTYRGQGYRRFTSADALWWGSTPTTAAAVACQ
jgi:hypothetical protein